jgi:hypothetical protein
LTLTQVSYTDWVQGGDNSLAYTATADGKSVDDEAMTTWTNTYKLSFGQARLGNHGLRKTDDFIDLSSVLVYKLGIVTNPYFAATLKTQFAKGFIYDDMDNATAVSQFFDPAFLTQSAGLEYQPVKEVKTRFGLALREVITNMFTQYANEPGAKDTQKIAVDGGMESVTNVNWNLQDNIALAYELDLFDAFKHLDEVVVRSNLTLTGKLSKYLTTIFNLQLINERRISPKTQVKESIALGLSYTVF